MAAVSMQLNELLELDPIKGARLVRASGTERVHAAELSETGADIALRGPDRELLACVVPAQRPAPRGPTVVLAPGVDVVAAFGAITHELLSRSQVLADRSSAILQSLAQADLEGRDLQSIVALLSTLVGNPVSLKDSAHRVMAWSGDPKALDRIRQDTVESGSVSDAVLTMLADEGVLERIRTERRPFRIESHEDVGLVPRVVCPVWSDDVALGYLSISEGGRRLDALDFTAVEYGATVVAFHLSRERAVAESIRSQKALLIYELLFNPSERSATSRRQAAMLRIDLSKRFAVLSFAVRPPASEAWDHERWARATSSMVATIDGALERKGVASAAALAEQSDLLLIVPVGRTPPHDLAATLVRELGAYHEATVAAVGISQTRDGSCGLKDSYEEARLAADLGRTMNGAGSITYYADLGTLRLLNEVPGDALQRHLSATLGDDPKFRDQFLGTYGALVEAGYNKAAAARRLYIHVNTLKYRLARITRTTGHDPADHNGRFALECTLRLLELRQARQHAQE